MVGQGSWLSDSASWESELESESSGSWADVSSGSSPTCGDTAGDSTNSAYNCPAEYYYVAENAAIALPGGNVVDAANTAACCSEKTCANTDGSSTAADCGNGATCGEGGTGDGYSCTCDAGYWGVATTNEAAACTEQTEAEMAEAEAAEAAAVLANACGTNEHVQDNECVPCPLGTTRPAGDDKRYTNTDCSTTVCLANEYVLAHTCQTCPTGFTNDADDQATGPDT